MIIEIFLIFFAVAFIVLIFMSRRKSDNRRSEAIEKLAGELGMSFDLDGSEFKAERQKSFPEFFLKKRARCKNVMYCEESNLQKAVFDYEKRATGSHGNSTKYWPALYFKSPALQLPRFLLAQGQAIQIAIGAFGVQGVNFENHPIFSKNFSLIGDNEEAIREFFNEKRLSFFEKSYNGFDSEVRIGIEANKDELVIFRTDYEVEPKDFQSFMKEGHLIFEQMQNTEV